MSNEKKHPELVNAKNGFLSKINKIGRKITEQRHLAAIHDSFSTMIPLLIAGSIGILVSAIVFGGGGSGYVSILGLLARIDHPKFSNQEITNLIASTDNGWGKTSAVLSLVFGTVNGATIGMMSLYFSFLFGYYIAKSKNYENPIIVGLICVTALIISSLGNISFVQGAQGLIAAIIVTIITAELFIKLASFRPLAIRLPKSVPTQVGISFIIFVPVLITLGVVAALNLPFLIPAYITHNLYVQQGKNFTFGNWDSFWKIVHKNILINDTVNESDEQIQSATWFNKDLWDTMECYFNSGTVSSGVSSHEFANWFNGLNNSEKHIVSSYIAILVNGLGISDSANSILNPESSSIMNVIVTNNDVIVSGNYQYIEIDYSQFGFSQGIFQFVSSWFIKFSTGNGALGIAILYVVLVSVFWIFGIHGTNILLGIFHPIFVMIVGINAGLVESTHSYINAKETGAMGIFAAPFFDCYVFIGGAGASLTLVIPTLIFSKRNDLREIAKYATPAGVFQINEPVIFGYPIILNGIYAFPFIFTQIVNVLIAWFFVDTGVVKMQIVQTPWTTPWFIGAMISSVDVKAMIPAFINFGIDMAIYIPFIILDNYLYFKKLKQSDFEQYEVELKYFSDPEYRYNAITEKKVIEFNERAEKVVSESQEFVKYLDEHMKDKKKFEERKDYIMRVAMDKKIVLLNKAEVVKDKREAKIHDLRPKWNDYKFKKMRKEEQKKLNLELKENKKNSEQKQAKEPKIKLEKIKKPKDLKLKKEKPIKEPKQKVIKEKKLKQKRHKKIKL